jgi:hypothetical protein
MNHIHGHDIFDNKPILSPPPSGDSAHVVMTMKTHNIPVDNEKLVGLGLDLKNSKYAPSYSTSTLSSPMHSAKSQMDGPEHDNRVVINEIESLAIPPSPLQKDYGHDNQFLLNKDYGDYFYESKLLHRSPRYTPKSHERQESLESIVLSSNNRSTETALRSNQSNKLVARTSPLEINHSVNTTIHQ